MKSLVKNNVFYDMSLCQTKGQDAPAQGILKNYLSYVKKF